MRPWHHGVLAGSWHSSPQKSVARTFNPQPRTSLAHIAHQCFTLVLLLFVCWTSTSYASNYVYDGNGRLVAVTNASGNTVVYSYDAVGNILSIQPISINQLALFTFDPPQGPVGTTVTIQGNGFSTTPSINTVRFNGTAATVTSVTSTQLVVQVPSGAAPGLSQSRLGPTPSPAARISLSAHLFLALLRLSVWLVPQLLYLG